MSSAGGTIAVSTYQAGRVGFIGWDGAQVSLLMREFEKPMGLAVSGSTLAIAARNPVGPF
jgi:hypothetical protein